MDKVLEYWNDEKVQSMYDKILIGKEIDIISSYLTENSRILDAGCGEGEGTLVYSKTPGCQLLALDFSETRLSKAKKRMENCENVKFATIDLKSSFDLGAEFDCIITQRSLINLPDWDCQKKTIKKLMAHLAPKGRMILCEGSQQGNETLNMFRIKMNLPPINIRWHNSFICDEKLQNFFALNNFELTGNGNLGAYYFLTRAIRPVFDKELNWDSEFNQMVKNVNLSDLIPNIDEFSKLKIWVFQKK